MDVQTEQRRFLRKKVKAQVVFKIKGAANEDYKTYISDNLSEHGLFLKTSDAYPIDTKVELLFSLANNPKLLKIDGEVKWIKTPQEETTAHPAGIGVEFTTMRAEDRKIIKHFLDSSL